MNRSALVVAIALASTACWAQDDDTPGLSAASAHYHKYRLMENKPPYQLKRVKWLIDHKPEINDDYGDYTEKMAKAWRSLSTPGKFTYCMLWGETFSQNCDGMPAFLNEEKKIFAYPLGAFSEEEDWSDRQRAFLHVHAKEVIQLIRATMKSQKRVGANLKKAIIELEAIELIPDMLQIYRRDQKDKDILSTCCVLMNDAKYNPFEYTQLSKQLYGYDANHQSFVTADGHTERFIMATATDLWRLRKG